MTDKPPEDIVEAARRLLEQRYPGLMVYIGEPTAAVLLARQFDTEQRSERASGDRVRPRAKLTEWVQARKAKGRSLAETVIDLQTMTPAERQKATGQRKALIESTLKHHYYLPKKK